MKRLTERKVFDMIFEMNIEYFDTLMSIGDAQALAKRIEKEYGEYGVETDLIIRDKISHPKMSYSSLNILGKTKEITEIRVEMQEV